jgi:hypothetical protein
MSLDEGENQLRLALLALSLGRKQITDKMKQVMKRTTDTSLCSNIHFF